MRIPRVIPPAFAFAFAFALAPTPPALGQMGGGGAAMKKVVVTVQYDRGQDQTTLGLPGIPAMGSPRVGAMFDCPGRKTCVPNAVLVLLIVAGEKPQYEGVSEVAVAVDGRDTVMKFPVQYAMQGEPMSRQSQEMISWAMPTADFIAVAEAKTAGVVLAGHRIELTADQRNGLGLLAKRIPKP